MSRQALLKPISRQKYTIHNSDLGCEVLARLPIPYFTIAYISLTVHTDQVLIWTPEHLRIRSNRHDSLSRRPSDTGICKPRSPATLTCAAKLLELYPSQT